MKKLFVVLTLCLSLVSAAYAGSFGFKGEPFHKEYWLGATATGKGDGSGPGNVMAISGNTLTLDAIPAGTMVEKAYAVVDVAVVGPTNFDLGDDDDADGMFDGGASGGLNSGLGTPGLYHYDAKSAGAYLATTVTITPKAKYYSGAKSLFVTASPAASAGSMRVIVDGKKLFQ